MELAAHDPDINSSSYLLGCPFRERSIKHYSNFHQILLVGEGDFTFSSSLANAFGSAENMVPTSLDSREKVLQSYKSAHETLSNLEKLGAMILHEVDARTMEEHHILRKMRFHRIVYNFPHAGFYGPESDKTVIEKHRDLLKMFFKNARSMLSEIGELHVTHKESDPYKKWELVKQAEECGLLLKESVHFTIADYPGYTNRRGSGSKAGRTFLLGQCRTYKFVLGLDLLYERELMAIQVVLPNAFSEASAENFKLTSFEPESESQVSIAGEMERADAETSFNCLEMLADKEFSRQRKDTLHQIAHAWRVKAKIAEQLEEALDLKEDTIQRKDASLREAILELESEIPAIKDAETGKAHLEISLKHLKVVLIKEHKKNNELQRLRNEALRQREEGSRKKTNIAKHLQKGMMPSLVSSCLAFALYLFCQRRYKVKCASKIV